VGEDQATGELLIHSLPVEVGINTAASGEVDAASLDVSTAVPSTGMGILKMGHQVGTSGFFAKGSIVSVGVEVSVFHESEVAVGKKFGLVKGL
jgi:hypothetical protein